MTALRLGWKYIAVSALVVLMTLGMVACEKQQSEPINEGLSMEQGNTSVQDSENNANWETGISTGENTDTDVGSNAEGFSESDFENGVVENTADSNKEEIPADDKEVSYEGDFLEDDYDGPEIVLPTDEWE